MTRSPVRTRRVLKRWLIAIRRSTVASDPVTRTYSSEFCRAREPRSKTSVGWSFNLPDCSALELSSGSVFF